VRPSTPRHRPARGAVSHRPWPWLGCGRHQPRARCPSESLQNRTCWGQGNGSGRGRGMEGGSPRQKGHLVVWSVSLHRTLAHASPCAAVQARSEYGFRGTSVQSHIRKCGRLRIWRAVGRVPAHVRARGGRSADKGFRQDAQSAGSSAASTRRIGSRHRRDPLWVYRAHGPGATGFRGKVRRRT
jgi:hypothetical protein